MSRFALVDGRPADAPWMVAEMIAAFEPGTVPILSRHGGILVGYLDSLTHDGTGRDLEFAGSLADFPDLTPRLRSGVPVSAEVLPPVGIPIGGMVARPRSYFRGVRTEGYQLVGVAIVWPPEQPAAAGSRMVIDE